MGQQRPFHQIGRRGFLKTLSALGGALTLFGLGAPHIARAMSPVSGRVGLLMPPNGARNLEAAMRATFAITGGITLMTEQTDGGPASTLEKAQKLIAQNQPDLLVGAAGPQGLDLLRPLLAQTGTVFIAVDSGANAVRKSEYSPWVFYQTLGYWHAGWAAGQWAARHLGGRAFAASSFFESGYDALASFQVSFEAAGGTVLQTSVTHVPPDPFDWQTLFAAIRGARPDFVYALYGGDLAVAFVQAYAASGLAETIPLMGAPSLVDEALLPQQGAAALGLRSCHTFLEPDGFATLGCETAHMIVGALAGAGDAGGIAAALREVRITGPRGRLRMQPTTQSVSMPVYLREVRQGASGVRNEVIAALGMVAEDDPRLAPLTEGLRTGWLHAHLG